MGAVEMGRRRVVAAGRLGSSTSSDARVVCRSCELVGHLLVAGAAAYLSGVHDHLHHGGALTAEVQAARAGAGVAA